MTLMMVWMIGLSKKKPPVATPSRIPAPTKSSETAPAKPQVAMEDLVASSWTPRSSRKMTSKSKMKMVKKTIYLGIRFHRVRLPVKSRKMWNSTPIRPRRWQAQTATAMKVQQVHQAQRAQAPLVLWLKQSTWIKCPLRSNRTRKKSLRRCRITLWSIGSSASWTPTKRRTVCWTQPSAATSARSSK